MARPTVRFLGHGAERSGPPIYLLRLLRRWALHRPEFDVQVVVACPGPLVEDYRRLAPTSVARLDRRSPERILQRVVGAAGLPDSAEQLTAVATRLRTRSPLPDITVVNGATVPTVELLRELRPTGRVLTIAHELSTGWMGNLCETDRQFLLGRTDRFLAVSRAVETYLVGSLGVDPSSVNMVHPPIDITEHGGDRADAVPEGLVAGSGMTDWRKAPESWLRVASGVLRRLPDSRVRFVWVGGEPPGSAAFWPLQHEIAHLDLEGRVEFLGQIDRPLEVLARASVFVSTAREDAYPLACAEAASLGVPVVGFDGDGVAELVDESAEGVVVPYPDEELLADEVAALLRDGDRRRDLGRNGAKFAREMLDVSTIASDVEAWILDRVA